MDFLEELKWRGLLQDITPGVEDLLKAPTVGYIGFDPTADDLHVGNLLQIITLLRFKAAGHTPIAVIGDTTCLIGDPSGKSLERTLLDDQTGLANTQSIERCLRKFPGITLLKNSDWSNFNFIDFVRDIGKHVTVNSMLAKDSVKARIERGISFTEFCYQLLQANDFLHLFSSHNCQLQLGGSDQWGNIVLGLDLIRKKLNGSEAHGITTKLIVKSDGTKFGKSESGNIWLSAEKTSPYKFYQYWLNISDYDAERLLKYFTFLSRQEIDNAIERHQYAPHGRIMQKLLAQHVTTLVHGEDEYKKALNASVLIFQGDFTALTEDVFLDAFEGVPYTQIKLTGNARIVDILHQFMSSKSDVRRAIQAGSLALNKIKVLRVDDILTLDQLLFGKYAVFQNGKKNYFLVEVINNECNSVIG